MKRIALIACLALAVGAFGSVHKADIPKPNVPEATQSRLQGLQKYQGTLPFVGQHPRKQEATPLPPSSTRAASVISGSAGFVAEYKGSGAAGHPVENASATKVPMIALLLGCGTFFSFWVAGKRQKEEKKPVRRRP